MTLNSLRRAMYKSAKLLGDVQAVSQSSKKRSVTPLGKRVGRRITGKLMGRLMGALFPPTG